MDIVGMTTEDRLWESKLQNVLDKLDNLSVSVSRDIGHLTDSVKTNFAQLVRMVEDHEQRLRKQAEIDGAQGTDISNLRVQVTELKGEIKEIKTILETRDQRDNDIKNREIGRWQSISIELLKIVLAAGAGGGTVYAAHVLRLFNGSF